MANTTTFNGEEVGLQELCTLIYDLFGQQAVMDFVIERQDVGDLPHILWDNCEPCEAVSPMDFDFISYFCLVCGTAPKKSPLTGEDQ